MMFSGSILCCITCSIRRKARLYARRNKSRNLVSGANRDLTFVRTNNPFTIHSSNRQAKVLL